MWLKRTVTIAACCALLATIPLLTGCSTGQSTSDACNQVGPIVSSFNNDLGAAETTETTVTAFTARADKDLAALHKSYATVTNTQVKNLVISYEKKARTFVTATQAVLKVEQATGKPIANSSSVLHTFEDAQAAWTQAN